MEDLRPVMTTYAYNVLGVMEDAKDIVQDVYLKFMQVDQDKIEDKKAYLLRMVTNFAINHKKRLHQQLTHYPGTWLPEPVATDNADRNINRAEILSYSLMVMLEKLNPKERAVFILKEAYDYGHAEIAELLEISPDLSRQLLSRAKKQLKNNGSTTPRADVSGALSRLVGVIQKANMHEIERVLHDDIAISSDGGGKATAAIKEVAGKQPALAMLTGLHKKFFQMHGRYAVINHLPALLHYDEGRLVTCEIFVFEAGLLRNVYFIRNPDKLAAVEKMVG